jgi:hypothetical protein
MNLRTNVQPCACVFTYKEQLKAHAVHMDIVNNNLHIRCLDLGSFIIIDTCEDGRWIELAQNRVKYRGILLATLGLRSVTVFLCM